LEVYIIDLYIILLYYNNIKNLNP